MSNHDKQILIKVLNEIEIISFLMEDINNCEDFIKDEKTKRAVCMTLINIGELVKNLSDEIKEEYKSIPWRAISGMRDIAAHKYQTIKMEDVWTTITDDIPTLYKEISTILK